MKQGERERSRIERERIKREDKQEKRERGEIGKIKREERERGKETGLERDRKKREIGMQHAQTNTPPNESVHILTRILLGPSPPPSTYPLCLSSIHFCFEYDYCYHLKICC